MLPTNPRAGRSVSIGARRSTDAQPRSGSRPRAEYPVQNDGEGRSHSQQQTSIRQVRSQRSVGNLSSARGNQTFEAPPPLPRSGPKSVSSNYPRAPPSRGSDSSSSSLSSSGSSFLDRMRTRNLGSSSSQSSLEIEQEKEETATRRFKLNKPRNQESLQNEITEITASDATPEAEQKGAISDYASYGFSIWGRIAGTASSWAWPGTTLGDMTTTNKHESEVTRVLKAYHIGKARDRSDLPDWLFDEHERRPSQTTQTTQYEEEESSFGYPEREATTRTRGTRNVRDTAASITVASRRMDVTDHAQFGVGSESPGASKATNRLKALRDAKRQAAMTGSVASTPRTRSVEEDQGSPYSVNGFDGRLNVVSASMSSSRRGDDVRGMQEPGKRIAHARVGLPTNPRRR